MQTRKMLILHLIVDSRLNFVGDAVTTGKNKRNDNDTQKLFIHRQAI